MGNYISCSSSSSCACLEEPSGGAESKRKVQRCMIMVVHSVEGRVIEVGGGGPMKVAEMMLEFPGQFVCQLCETDTNMNPLPADDEALPGRVYILFPMHTRLSPHDCSSYIKLILHGGHLHSTSSPAPAPARNKLNLHSFSFKHFSASGSKVTPLNTMQLSHEDLHSFLQPPKGSTVFPNNSAATGCTLSRSKSWIPSLETIRES